MFQTTYNILTSSCQKAGKCFVWSVGDIATLVALLNAKARSENHQDWSQFVRQRTHTNRYSSFPVWPCWACWWLRPRQVEVIWSRLRQHQLQRLWITTPWAQHIEWRRKFWICLFSSHAVSLCYPRFWRQSQKIAQGCARRNSQKQFSQFCTKLSSQKCLQLFVICAAMGIAIYECTYYMI